jgi:hypothetical protein
MRAARLDEHAAEFRARFAPKPVQPRVVDLPVSNASPWLTSLEAAELVRCPTREAFRKWAHRAGIVAVHRGRRVLYARVDVLNALFPTAVR